MHIPIEEICGFGVGGALAALIFLMYRRDKNSTEKRIDDICQGHEQRLREDREQLVSMIKSDQSTREKHTEVLQELTTTLKRMNGRK